MDYATIDPKRAEMAGGKATHAELFKVLEYVRQHRNRTLIPGTAFRTTSKSITEMARELDMTQNALREGLWYWSFVQAHDDAARIHTPLEPYTTRRQVKFNPTGQDDQVTP